MSGKKQLQTDTRWTYKAEWSYTLWMGGSQWWNSMLHSERPHHCNVLKLLRDCIRLLILSWLVGVLTSLFSTNTAISETSLF